MNNKIYIKVALSLCLLFAGCGPDPEELRDNLEGYWEITRVEKDGKLVKSYSISTHVDYFLIETDTSGFRKKVRPQLDGSFLVTQHQTPFNLIQENGNLLISYKGTGASMIEQVIKADKEQLILENEGGMRYIYKAFTQLTLD